MKTIQEIRQKYPQYKDLSDDQLARGLHQKYYSDLDYGDFSQRIGLTQAAVQPAQPEQEMGAIERGLGLTGRAMAGAAASFADLPRILTDAGASAVAMGAEALNAPETARAAREYRAKPYFSDMAKQAYDRATGGKYAPMTGLEEGSAIASEIGFSFISPSAWAKLGQQGVKGLQQLGGMFNSGATMDSIPKEYKKIVDVLRAEGKTDADIIQIAEKASKSDIPTTVFEVAESPKGTALQRALTEEPSAAGSKLQEFNKQRLTQSFPDVAAEEAARGATTTSSYQSGENAKTLAQSIIGDAKKARMEAVRPQYEKAASDILPDELIQGFVRDPVYQKALESVQGDAGFQRLTQGMPKNSAGYWDYVYRSIRDKGQTLQRSGDSTLAGAYGKAANDLRESLDRVSPALKLGREEHAALSPEVMRLEKGLVGRIANAKSPEKIGDIIFSEAPEVIEKTKAAYMAKDPQAWQDITSSLLQRQLEKSTSIRTFASQTNKNSLVRNKIKAMLTPEQYAGHRILLDSLMKIEKGLPTGSNTIPKAQAVAELSSGTLDERIVQRLASNPNMRSQFAEIMVTALRTGKSKVNTAFKSSLADALTSPDLAKLRKAVNGKERGSPEYQAIINEYLLDKLIKAGAANAGSAGMRQDFDSDAEASQPPAETLPKGRNTTAPEEQSGLDQNSELLQKIAMAESGGNPDAKAKTSSASGLFQITDKTWAGLVKKYGKDFGIKYAQKNDPEAQRIMAGQLLQENKAALSRNLKREPTTGELYIAHFMGAPAASRFIRRKNESKAAAIDFPKEARANKAIFFTNGRPRSYAQIYELLTNKVA